MEVTQSSRNWARQKKYDPLLEAGQAIYALDDYNNELHFF